MSDDIRIAACREAELPALMRFIGTHWRAGHILSRDETLLRWQFDPTLIKGRSLPGPSVMLAWHGDEIVGILGLIGFDLNVAGASCVAAGTQVRRPVLLRRTIRLKAETDIALY